MEAVVNVLSWILLVSGAVFSVIGGIGILRFPDFYSRVHAAGITDTMGDEVFERFTQGDMTATREFQGAGLGLAVVREIVNGHNGHVRLVPPVLSGTAIRIALPVAEGA